MKVKIPTSYPKIDENSPIGDRIKARRLELKLRQMDTANLVGVTEDALRFWETGLTVPRIEHIPKVIEFLGYNPYPFDTTTLGSRLKYYRLLHGLSHKKMGKLLGVDPATISTWETNTFTPNRENLDAIHKLLAKYPSEADLGNAEAQPNRNSLETGMVGEG